MKKIFVIITLAIGILASCADPFADKSNFLQDTSALPAASYMEQTDSLNLSMWVELLKYTDLYNTMNLAANYTCFVPTNDALQAYLKEKAVSKVTDLSVDDARILVKYHTIKGAAYSAVSFEDGMIADTTATGDYLSSSFSENGGKVRINLEATITKTIKTNNAYIHILNTTLTPVTETLWEKLQSSDYSIFRQAVEATGYSTMLNTVSATINGIVYKYHYTMFAVPDSVFKANNISSLSVLTDSLKAGSDYTSASNALNLYVGYHLMNQQVSYASLAYFADTDTKRTKNYTTVATNQQFNISEVNKVLYINYNTTTKKGANFLAINRNCKNGVMHAINGLMKVTVPKATTVTWEFTDYSILSSLLSKYRVTGLTSDYYSYLLSQTAFTCYKWSSVPEFRINSIAYFIANKNSAEQYKAVNKDYLYVNLGKFGWVEMTTPVILAGKYTVSVGHYLIKSTANQGALRFYVDGNDLFSIATQSLSATKNQYLENTGTSTITITFKESTTHKVRIMAADDIGSYIDYMKFTPSN